MTDPPAVLSAVADDADLLFAILPTDGSTIGGLAARKQLGWNEDRYYATRDRLSDQGRIFRGVGRGGSIGRPIQEPVETVEVAVPIGEDGAPVSGSVADLVRRESDLYQPMREVLNGSWARDNRKQPLGVEITAQQGSRETGGAWSRPDITVVEVRKFLYIPGTHLEVTTFEVKPQDSVNVQAVYEALAHRRASTHAYVLLHIPSEKVRTLSTAVAEVAQVARSHGIGVITAEEPANYETWTTVELALRVEPDPGRLSEFVQKQLSQDLREKLQATLQG